MKTTSLVSMIAVMVTLLIGTTAAAGRGHGRGGKGGGDDSRQGVVGEGRRNPVDRMVRDLALTAEQESEIRALFDAHRAVTKPIREKVRELKAAMREAWRAEQPNEGEILAIHREIHQLKGELRELGIQHRLDVHAMLTPEQREKAGRFGKGRGMGRGNRGPGFGPGCGPDSDSDAPPPAF